MIINKNNKNLEILSNDPRIIVIKNFLSDELCDHFINLSNGKLKRALVSSEKEGIISKGRSGSNCWIEHNKDDKTLSVANRISNIIEIPLESTESFQIIYYDKTQEYFNHYDAWDFNEVEKSRRNLKNGGQRIFTALVYLNDVEEGGSTKFTKLNIDVKAEKGKLLIFENVYEDTNIRHYYSEHAGRPVIKGEKYAFNLWFRECPINKLYSEFNPNFLKKIYCKHNLYAEKLNENIEYYEDLITKEEVDKVKQLAYFGNKNVIWINKNLFPSIVSKIEKISGKKKETFTNFMLTKYAKNSNTGTFYDAYDINTEHGKTNVENSGQRYYTCLILISNSTKINFINLKINKKLENKSVLFYKNMIKNSNERNPDMKKFFSNIEDSILLNLYILKD
jgi:prolyl 4-hydroxylase